MSATIVRYWLKCIVSYLNIIIRVYSGGIIILVIGSSRKVSLSVQRRWVSVSVSLSLQTNK